MRLREGCKLASLLDLNRLRKEGHGDCIACIHPDLRLEFSLEGPDRLRASVDFKESMTSYGQMVHSGVQSFVMQEAMICALLACGIYATPIYSKTSYLKPVRSEPSAYIYVSIKSEPDTLLKAEAELWQGGKVCSIAKSGFLELSPEDL
ncbi:PaaI family thioesterase [Pelagicoccus albus]|uniref:Thioesterase superfamily protein n=1 Tax=Pelagicoccus albus TaxID=415222 RepID=A0A7X1E8H2_9BACT|nr:hypothetical protein [Pelagicoccus albus]MBC2606261.1 hypothetical protein [Pelagicoccus albus]